MLSNYVVVEVEDTTRTLILLQYLLTQRFDKFSVLTDLRDHPSLKSYGTNPGADSSSNSPESNEETSSEVVEYPLPNTLDTVKVEPQSSETLDEPRISMVQLGVFKIAEDRASSFPSLVEAAGDQTEMRVEQLHDRRQIDTPLQMPIHRALTSLAFWDWKVSMFGGNRAARQGGHHQDMFGEPSGDEVKSPISSERHTYSEPKHGGGGKAPPSRWQRTTNQLLTGVSVDLQVQEGRRQRRSSLSAIYKCALCDVQLALRSVGSRSGLMQHVISVHSEHKPYKCSDCDYTGVRNYVRTHARTIGHRLDDAVDITTSAMQAEWTATFHECFPDFFARSGRPDLARDKPNQNGPGSDNEDRSYSFKHFTANYPFV